MTTKLTPCTWCRHLDRDRFDGSFCTAYPDGEGIPREIILGWIDHRDPYPGDGGIQYEPRPGAPDLPRVDGGPDTRAFLERAAESAAVRR